MKFEFHKEEYAHFDILSGYPFSVEDLQLPKEIIRYFKVNNYGNLPIRFEHMSIEQNGCKGFGFEIRNCEAFTLAPNGHHILEIAFSLDYSQKQATHVLYLMTKKEIFLFYLHVDLPFLASTSIKSKGEYDYYEFKLVEGVSLITILLFVFSLLKSLRYKNYMRRKMRGEWKLVEASDVFELRDQNSVFSFENDIYELRKLRQAVKQTSNYSHTLLFEPPQGFESPNVMEMNENAVSISERKNNENRPSIDEQREHVKQEFEMSEREDKVMEEGKGEKKAERKKKEDRVKKSKAQEKKKSVKKEVTSKPAKKPKKEENTIENKEAMNLENNKKDDEGKTTLIHFLFDLENHF